MFVFVWDKRLCLYSFWNKQVCLCENSDQAIHHDMQMYRDEEVSLMPSSSIWHHHLESSASASPTSPPVVEISQHLGNHLHGSWWGHLHSLFRPMAYLYNDIELCTGSNNIAIKDSIYKITNEPYIWCFIFYIHSFTFTCFILMDKWFQYHW